MSRQFKLAMAVSAALILLTSAVDARGVHYSSCGKHCFENLVTWYSVLVVILICWQLAKAAWAFTAEGVTKGDGVSALGGVF
jgi:hypothetical protein